MKICSICHKDFQEKQETEKYCSTQCAYDGMKLKAKERTQKMKKQETMTTASEKISLTTKDLASVYASIKNAEPRGRILKEIYCGHLKSFQAYLSKYVPIVNADKSESSVGALFGVKVSEKSFMPRNLALLIDQTGEQFAVVSYDIVE